MHVTLPGPRDLCYPSFCASCYAPTLLQTQICRRLCSCDVVTSGTHGHSNSALSSQSSMLVQSNLDLFAYGSWVIEVHRQVGCDNFSRRAATVPGWGRMCLLGTSGNSYLSEVALTCPQPVRLPSTTPAPQNQFPGDFSSSATKS